MICSPSEQEALLFTDAPSSCKSSLFLVPVETEERWGRAWLGFLKTLFSSCKEEQQQRNAGDLGMIMENKLETSFQ